MKNNYDVIIIGGGVAGLMAGIELVKNGKKVAILEKESMVGGQCRTQVLNTTNHEFRFDYGGHRFITNNEYLLNYLIISFSFNPFRSLLFFKLTMLYYNIFYCSSITAIYFALSF